MATKLFSENEAEFEGNKTEERVIALFDKVKRRLQEKERRKAEKKEEAFITEELEKVPGLGGLKICRRTSQDSKKSFELREREP